MDTQTREILHNIPLKDYSDVPKTLLQKAVKSKYAIAIDDARDSYQPYYQDPYFVRNRDQQSVLCLCALWHRPPAPGSGGLPHRVGPHNAAP